MKPFTHSPPRVRLLAVLAVAGLCLLAWNLSTTTFAGPNLVPPSPAKTVVVPGAQLPATAGDDDLADQDIRDIRPPYHIASDWPWLAWTAGGLALLALGYGAWRWYRRHGTRLKLPYEIALEQLEAVRRLMQPEQARAFSIAVSEVVRGYIEKCFPVRAAHRTTNEFLHDLVTRPDSPLVAYQPVLADFLHHCDLAKFARWMLSVPEMEAMLQSAAAFIVATGKPVAKGSPARAVGPTSASPSLTSSALLPTTVSSNNP